MLEVLYSSPASLQGAGHLFTREDHRLKELALIRTEKRAPRRSQTHQNYEIPEFPAAVVHDILQQLRVPDAKPTRSVSPVAEKTQQDSARAPTSRRRPPLGPPRRSYSVTDCAPIPHHHRPSTGVTLLDLPAELHFAIFDFLDSIDSTCLGLTNKHFYSIHRRMRGTVSLAARREGPNSLEWAWHLAGAVVQSPAPPCVKPVAAKTASKPEAWGGIRYRNSVFAARVTVGSAVSRVVSCISTFGNGWARVSSIAASNKSLGR